MFQVEEPVTGSGLRARSAPRTTGVTRLLASTILLSLAKQRGYDLTDRGLKCFYYISSRRVRPITGPVNARTSHKPHQLSRKN